MPSYSLRLPARKFSVLDLTVLIFIFASLYAIIALGRGMTASYIPDTSLSISLDPTNLPYYAGRSLLRMFLAFGASLLFSFLYGYTAARSSLARKLLIPALDILQSIPVLGFLAATINALMALFPHSLLGAELASLLAIFTGMAWNMTFSFYHSLTTLPRDLQEAAAILHLNRWQQFIRLELPFSIIGLVWNSMMSFGGAWFFLAASEAITVLNQDIRLPGIGSYLAAAIDQGDLQAIFFAIATMIALIILVDQLFWRPLVVWSQRFKMEQTDSSEQIHSFIYDLLRRSFLIQYLIRCFFLPLLHLFSNLMNHLSVWGGKFSDRMVHSLPPYMARHLSLTLLVITFIYLLYTPFLHACELINSQDHTHLLQVLWLGMYTLLRVLAAVILGALWTIPVGVWIGMNPRLARICQPLVQIAASFPANMLFPFITFLFLRWHINFDWGSVGLMMLGTQWYILFNVIAGAMSIPTDLKEAGSVYHLTGWQRWRTLIIPSIFPYLVTGLITASGGAWNASIVSELVSWHGTDLVAAGLGAYINQVTGEGDWGGILWGLLVMCLFVVILNRLIWRRLYRLTETKYHLE